MKRKASEFVIGTVKLSSAHTCQLPYPHLRLHILPPPLYKNRAKTEDNRDEGTKEKGIRRTSLPNQQEEPHTPRNIDEKRQRVGRPAQKVHDGKVGAQQRLRGAATRRIGKRGVRAGDVRDCSSFSPRHVFVSGRSNEKRDWEKMW